MSCVPQIHAGLVWQDIRELDLFPLGEMPDYQCPAAHRPGNPIIRIGFPTDDFHESRITDLNSAYIVHKKEAVEIGFVNRKKEFACWPIILFSRSKGFLRSRLFPCARCGWPR